MKKVKRFCTQTGATLKACIKAIADWFSDRDNNNDPFNQPFAIH